MSLAVLPIRAGAQPTPGVRTGNPTPGTPQPDPPNLADRITLTGCVRRAEGAAPASATPASAPSDARFLLTNARKGPRVPPGTGTSPAATAPAAETYRLEALDSHLSAFVGVEVEISGEVKTPDADAPAGSGPPVLLVEFVQRIAATCP
jgi:hypothetical protein